MNLSLSCKMYFRLCVTGAPGVTPVAGKPGLTMGIMGAPGAPGFRQTERKRESETQYRPTGECEGPPKGLVVHQGPVMSAPVSGHYWIIMDWWSYHGEAGVSPHKRRDTHGYGL